MATGNNTDNHGSHTESRITAYEELLRILICVQRGSFAERADISSCGGRDKRVLETVNQLLDLYADRQMPPVGATGNANALIPIFERIAMADYSLLRPQEPIAPELEQAFHRAMTRTVRTLKSVQDSVGGIAAAGETLATAALSAATQSAEVSQGARDLSQNTEKALFAAKSTSDLSRQISAASTEAYRGVNSLTSGTQQISSNIRSISQATEHVSGSVATVAAAVEEMSASLNEVSNNSSRAAVIANDATDAAKRAALTMDNLGKSAKAIGKVVDMIKGIASQTNLLALNATIEAASAGDAGKGFAVVANEVKELAKQTASATEDIRSRVEEMQEATALSVKAIQDVVGRIEQLNSISAIIAAAVEEQTATTNDMAKNLSSTASGAEQVSANVLSVANGANEVSSKVQTIEGALSDINHNILKLVESAGKVDEAATLTDRTSGMLAEGSGSMAHSVGEVQAALEMLTELAHSAMKELNLLTF